MFFYGQDKHMIPGEKGIIISWSNYFTKLIEQTYMYV